MTTLSEILRWFVYKCSNAWTRVVRALLRHDKLLLGSEKKFKALLESAPAAMVILDDHGHIGLINEQTERMIGYDRKEVIGSHLQEIFQREQRPEFRRDLKQYMRAPNQWKMGTSGGLYAVRKDGTRFPVEVRLAPLKTDAGMLVSVALRDMTEQRQNEKRLTYLAEHDSLTGLQNRRAFEARLDHESKRAIRHHRDLSMIMLDLDGLKEVNDTLGHAQGDELLKRVADILDGAVRETDMVARIGGDEFGVLLPETDAEEGLSVAQKLLGEVAARGLVLGDQRLRPSLCAGVSAVGPTCGTAEGIMVAADLALYAAKEGGRDRAELHIPDPDDMRVDQTRAAWSMRVRSALDDGRIVPYRQPIMSVADHKIDRYELLARLIEEDGSAVAPGAFMAAAERSGMIREIDRRMAGWAIDLIALSERAGSPVTYEVNLSARNFDDPELVPMIERRVAEAGIDPARLVFEITETAAMTDIVKARNCAEGLRALGCGFALDDFGAGFSSFHYLKHIPLDGLKIDGEFISGMVGDERDRLLVGHMAQIARDLGLFTVAEFVEDEETLHLLGDLGVDEAQGYFIGRPEKVTDLPNLSGRPGWEPVLRT